MNTKILAIVALAFSGSALADREQECSDHIHRNMAIVELVSVAITECDLDFRPQSDGCLSLSILTKMERESGVAESVSQCVEEGYSDGWIDGDSERSSAMLERLEALQARKRKAGWY